MAQARMERYGSIFTRFDSASAVLPPIVCDLGGTLGLIRSGALKFEDRPVWLDVYAAHPPITEPYWNRPPAVSEDRPLRKIFYEEDRPRAMFYAQIAASTVDETKLVDSSGVGIGQALDLDDVKAESHCQMFVTKYMELWRKKTGLRGAGTLSRTVNALVDAGQTIRPTKLSLRELCKSLIAEYEKIVAIYRGRSRDEHIEKLAKFIKKKAEFNKEENAVFVGVTDKQCGRIIEQYERVKQIEGDTSEEVLFNDAIEAVKQEHGVTLLTNQQVNMLMRKRGRRGIDRRSAFEKLDIKL